jgi:hypothetical protein
MFSPFVGVASMTGLDLFLSPGSTSLVVVDVHNVEVTTVAGVAAVNGFGVGVVVDFIVTFDALAVVDTGLGNFNEKQRQES